MSASSTKTPASSGRNAHGSVEYINPNGLLRNPAFSQVVVATGPVKTVYIGAQTPVDAAGTMIGKGDIAAQTEQILRNIGVCLDAAGAAPEHIVHWNIYVVPDQPIYPAIEASMRWWGGRTNPPANSVMLVAGFPLLPDVLLMIDAVAVIPA